MMNKRNIKNIFFLLITGIFCTTGIIFAYVEVNTSLGILPPPYEVIYTPAHISGTYVSGPVYVEITGAGIRENSTGIFINGTYALDFYRGTGPFTTGAAYSDSNRRTHLQTTAIINRIDSSGPTFVGVSDGATYDAPVTITFADDNTGVTATINGSPFTNGGSLSGNGTYQLIVTDAAGNTTSATFIIYLSTTPPPSGGGGGGSAGLGVRQLIAPQCATRSCYSSYYDALCGSCTPPKTLVIPGNRPVYHYSSPLLPSIENSPYPKERNDAYLRAYRLGITTATNIKDAEMETLLYRKFSAKMASEFAMKVVGRVADESRKCEFNDIDKEIPELQYYMKLSCKLGIMGVDYYGDPDTTFNPNYVLKRDQLVTIFSRILFGNQYNLKHGELTLYDQAMNFINHTLTNIGNALGIDLGIITPLDRYKRHFEAIKQLGIITEYSLTLKEFRGYVMIIMYRLDQMGIAKINAINATVTDPLK